MFKRFAYLAVSCLASVVLLAPVGGCSKEDEAKKAPPESDVVKEAETPKDAAPKADVAETGTGDAQAKAQQAKLEAMLAKADLVDGKADKIVTKCATCAFKMDGSSEHAVTASGYTLYFCTEDCAKKFSENTTESILAMKIPED